MQEGFTAAVPVVAFVGRGLEGRLPEFEAIVGLAGIHHGDVAGEGRIGGGIGHFQLRKLDF
jgi:hypothetical protein